MINAATLTVALPKVWVHFSNVQMLNFREDAGKHSAVSWRLLTSLSPHKLWQKPPLFHFQWIQTLTQKHVKPQGIYCRYICYCPHSVTALMAAEAALVQEESQWALESVPKRSRAIGSKEVEMICFPLSEGYCLSTVIKLNLTYKINTTGNRARVLLWTLHSLDAHYTMDPYAPTHRLARNFKAHQKTRTLNLDKLHFYYCLGGFF